MSTPAIVPHPPSKSLPPFLRAGDQLAWSVATKLAVGFSVFFVLTAVIKNVPTRISIDPVDVDANGAAAFSIPSSTTSTWAAGKYQWVCFATDADSNRSELAQGVIRIDPDPAGQTAVDPRTRNQKLLASVRCLLEGKALDDAQMYKIGERELTKMSLNDLLYWEAILESRVRRERIRRGEYVPTKTVGITFGGRSGAL